MWWLIPVGMQMMSGQQSAEAQKAQADAQAEQERMNALAQTAQIDRELTDILENQQIVALMQGRTGGTVGLIAEKSKRKAEIDKSLIRAGAESRATGFESYGRTARNAQLMQTYGQAFNLGAKATGLY